MEMAKLYSSIHSFRPVALNNIFFFFSSYFSLYGLVDKKMSQNLTTGLVIYLYILHNILWIYI